MVRNTTGGSSHKRFARKNQSSGKATTWDKSDPLLLEVSVVKPLGDCRFQVQTKERKILLCHVSSRFSGRFKHSNLVIASSLLLVSLRDYESPPKHCDFLQKLSDMTPVDFFTVQLDGYNSSADLELDIFQRHADVPTLSESSIPIKKIVEEEQNEVDFDAI